MGLQLVEVHGKKKTGANKKKQLCLVLDMVCGFLWEGFQEAAERCV